MDKKQNIPQKKQARAGIKKVTPHKATKKANLKGKKSFHIIAIGASAGGLNAMTELISQLPAGLNAAVFIVLHLSKAAIGDILVERIKRNSKLPCKLAQHHEGIRPAHIYIAPPDAHLLIKENKMVLGFGPAENRFRPSIDVLFRSAASSYRNRVIGIILTGFLNDGTAGMAAIQQSGGYCIVQDPNEAEYPSMPLSVLELIEADKCVSLKNMGDIIQDRIRNKGSVNKDITVPTIISAESRLSEKVATGISDVSTLGQKTVFSCPDCGGGLWNIENKSEKHYRCHIGHSYSEKDLEIRQTEAIENTLWVAIRMMEERKILLARLSRENNEKGLEQVSITYSEQGKQLEEHIGRMKELLFGMNRN